ncbi:tetratricopeptide repeat protein [Sulfurihydrogenibium subterraneum]|uniref:tetratricopeptide repeat protein n=1 Tax=Sulfurihydrogenibium subterraneum TaxID=171121 RepID=UPI0004905CFE|nr:hypothetical protein [Sulfurihydrogenibium subterraneum]
MNIDLQKKKKPMWKPTATKEIFSYKEIFGFVLIVVVLSVAIFPKGKIEKLIFQEDTNIDLSNIYLENLIRITDDDNLRLLLAERYINLGYKEKALTILKNLESDSDPEIRSKAKILSYRILKVEYFSKNTSNERQQELIKQMRKILLDSLNSTTNLNTLKDIYNESLSMAFVDIAYKTAMKAVSIKNDDLFWLKQAYAQALATQHYQDAQKLSYRLSKIDKNNSLKWLNEYYNISVAIKDYTSASKALKEMATIDSQHSFTYYKKLVNLYMYVKDYNSALNLVQNLYKTDTVNKSKWLDLMANIYLSQKDYSNAFNAYKEAFLGEKNLSKRKEYFKKSLEILLWSKKYDDLKTFLDSYYKEFLTDPEMAKFILKTSLATGDPKFAYKIALEMKQRGF